MNEYDRKIEKNLQVKADKTDGKNTYIQMDRVLPEGRMVSKAEYEKAKKEKRNISEQELERLMANSRKTAEREQMAQLNDRIETNNFQ